MKTIETLEDITFDLNNYQNYLDTWLNGLESEFIIISSTIYADEITQICELAGLKQGVDFWRFI